MATGDRYQGLGAKLKVAVCRPATEDQTGSFTWVDVEGVVSKEQGHLIGRCRSRL